MHRTTLISAGLLAISALSDSGGAINGPAPLWRAVWDSPPAGAASNDAPPVPLAAMAVKDLAFLVGRWEGTSKGRIFDEIWMPPRERMMIGSFRMLQNGDSPIMLMMIIEHRNDGIFFRMKQFDPDFVSLGQSFREYRLTELREKQVVFTATDESDPLYRIAYTRTGPHRLQVELTFLPELSDRGTELFQMYLQDRVATSGWVIPSR